MNVRAVGFGVLLVLLVLLGAFPGVAKEKKPVSGPFGGMLFRSLFDDPSAAFRLEDLDHAAFAGLPDTLKTRLETYAERYAGFRSRLTPTRAVGGLASSPSEEALYSKKQSMERAIVALSDTAGIEDRAAAYAIRAVLFHNWETKNVHILAEAVAAERSLDNPSLRPYLLLFLMHRYRCAYEYSMVGRDIHQAELISEKYREALRLAREYHDPLVRLMAEDLDGYQKNLVIPVSFTRGVAHP